MKLTGNKILITGGASGIGLGLTEMFLNEKNSVIVCGRRKEILDQLQQKHPSVVTRVCDLSKEDERVQLFEWIKEFYSDVNVLVNNAGIQNWMNVEQEDFFSKAKNEIAINIEGPIHLTSLFIKLNQLSTIINVTSGLSFCPLTKVAVYSATKAFFHSFTMSMKKELEAKNIEVIELIPPAINTDLGGKGLHDYAPPVSELIASIYNQLKEGKSTLTFGMSETMSKAGPEQIQIAFERMNNQ